MLRLTPFGQNQIHSRYWFPLAKLNICLLKQSLGGGYNLKFVSAILFAVTFLVGGFFISNTAFAITGEGTATIDGGANVTVTQATSHKFTVVLTVGASGITANAENPTFTIPDVFTAPNATYVANAGLVVADGDWSVIGGGTCLVESPVVGLTKAIGQVITVDVSTACTVGGGGTITLTYKGTSATVGTVSVDVGTNDVISYVPVKSISLAPNNATLPTITVSDFACIGTVGTSVFVSKSGTDSNNGSEACPFATIQAAIDDENTISGDTIIVGAGTYTEQVIIDKAVSVLGAGAATTFIDGTSVTPVLPGLVNITNETGAVTLDGFTIHNAPAKDGIRITIWAKQADEGPVYNSSMTITHNILVGSGPFLVPTDDYGLYSSHNKSNLVFSYNDVSNFGGNALLFELHTGSAEISHNNITVNPGGPTAIFSMSYKDGYSNNNDVTGKQWLHDNTINANGGSAIVMASAAGFAAYNDNTYGAYTNVEITNNVITNVGDAKKGIQLEVDGDNGGFVNPLITGNAISAQNPGSGDSRGIRIMGVVTGAQILDNVITGFYRGIYQSDSFSHLVYPTNTQISTNAITGGTYGIDLAGGTATIHLNSIVGNTLFGVNNQTVATIDATNNYWGDATGPHNVTTNPSGLGNSVSDYVIFSPYYIDANMTTTNVNLANAKTTAHSALTIARALYTDANYTIGNLVILNGFKSNGDTNIDAATDLAGVTSAQSTATVGMAGVAVISQHHTTSGSIPRPTTVVVTTPAPVGQVLGAEAYNFTLLIRNNSKGNEVIELQKYLITNGYLTGIADGSFGPKTLEGVKKFQTANSLVADGIVGPAARAVLNRALVTPATPADGSGAVSVTYNFGTTNLKNGSHGDAVQELQRFLNNTLGLELVVDGKLGPKTIAVIKQWQGDNGLVADGIIGLKTKALMNSTFK